MKKKKTVLSTEMDKEVVRSKRLSYKSVKDFADQHGVTVQAIHYAMRTGKLTWFRMVSHNKAVVLDDRAASYKPSKAGRPTLASSVSE